MFFFYPDQPFVQWLNNFRAPVSFTWNAFQCCERSNIWPRRDCWWCSHWRPAHTEPTPSGSGSDGSSAQHSGIWPKQQSHTTNEQISVWRWTKIWVLTHLNKLIIYYNKSAFSYGLEPGSASKFGIGPKHYFFYYARTLSKDHLRN